PMRHTPSFKHGYPARQATRVFLFAVLAVTILLAFSVNIASSAPQSTIVVNSNLDGDPANDGNCTLREAIINANHNDQSGSTDCAAGASDGADIISFSIGDSGGPQTLIPLSPLPALTDSVTIDGFTQPNCESYPCIELDGESAGTTAEGLRI